MRVTIRDVTYNKVREAAEALGVSPAHVYNMVLEGRQDSIGIGMGNWRKPRHTVFEKNRIKLHGVCFDSLKAASLLLGFNQHYIRGAIRRPSFKSTLRIMQAVMDYGRQTE